MKIVVDGRITDHNKPAILAANRSFRYGDGIFETMKLVDGKIRLELYHMERLFNGLSLLEIDPDSLSEETIHSNISELITANNCARSARIRLTVFRNENNSAGYVLEATPLEHKPDHPWTIDIYPYARKTMDAFANLKSANFLPYVMAGRFASEEKLDEALILNSEGNISDGSKTNVFLVNNSRVSTPALHQGCVNGVMRRHVIELLRENGMGVHQVPITEQQLLEADEVFVTNAIIGVQAVHQLRDKIYSPKLVNMLMPLVR